MAESPFIKTKVRKSSGRFMAYGVWWEPNVDPASMQIDCIRAGGRWVNKSTGEMAGEGNYYHYRKFQEIVWPERIWEKGPFKNYWAEKILEGWLEYKYFGLMGCAASGKSDSLGAICLTDWYPFSDCTTTIVSSTELQMLQRRIWGFIEKYHRLAKKRCPWIAGHLVQSKLSILQDTRDEEYEGKSHINAIFGVPCKRGNSYVGLGCFPAGTMVDAEFGPKPIESIRPGDRVLSAAGVKTVRKCSTRTSSELVRIFLNDGRVVDCTPNHPFFTSLGWKHSIDLSPEDYLLSPHETLLIMQEGNAVLLAEQEVLQRALRIGELQKGVPVVQESICSFGRQKCFLREILLDEIEDVRQGFCSDDKIESGYQGSWGKDEEVEKGSSRAFSKAGKDKPTSCWAGSICTPEAYLDHEKEEWRKGIQWKGKWMPTDASRSHPYVSFPEREIQHADSGKYFPQRERRMALGKSRHWLAGFEAGRGGRRGMPLPPKGYREGHEERQATKGAWVDRVEVLKRGDYKQSYEGEKGYRVYNLEVEGHPSYSVSGLVCHNSFVGLHNKRVRLVADEAMLMPKTFLDSTSNLSKCPDFKLCAPGNPNETTNAHGIICEPSPELGGWEGGIDQTPGTKTWKTRFPNGGCLQLPGADSPNLKAGELDEIPFPFICTRQHIAEEAAIWGSGDWHFDMFINAKMPRGQGSNRIITRQECEKHGATLEPFWRDSNITKIASLDAAYRSSGGDRCVFTEINFGRESESTSELMAQGALAAQRANTPQGRQIMALIDQVVIPIDGGTTADTPESQIRKFCQAQCEARGIPPENFYLDSGMRTSLVQEMSRNWSVDIQSVDCGAAPTEDRVSAEIDMPCHDYYKKLITQIWYTIRLVIISRQFRNLNKDVMWELCAREWKTTSGNKIEAESKAEMKEKTGKSPDLGDSLGLAVFGAIKRGFQIATLRNQTPRKTTGPDWRDQLRKQSKELWKSNQLEYAEPS